MWAGNSKFNQSVTLPDWHFISTFSYEAIFSRYHTSKIDTSMLMLSRQCPGSNQCFTASLGPEGIAPLCPYCEIKIDLALIKIFIYAAFNPNLDIYSSVPWGRKPCRKYDVHFLGAQHHRCCRYCQQSKKHKRGTSLFKHAEDFIRSLPLWHSRSINIALFNTKYSPEEWN